MLVLSDRYRDEAHRELITGAYTLGIVEEDGEQRVFLDALKVDLLVVCDDNFGYI